MVVGHNSQIILIREWATKMKQPVIIQWAVTCPTKVGYHHPDMGEVHAV